MITPTADPQLLTISPYASVPINGHYETYGLQSRKLKSWLGELFYDVEERTPTQSVIEDAKCALEGRALFSGPERQVCLRLAGHDGVVYLDLANAGWEVVEVTTTGWQVITDAPVRFRRPEGMHPLPTPVTGGSLDELEPFFNVATNDDFCLIVAWLLGALRPTGPYPVKVFSGESGAAKTTAAKCLQRLIDPGKATLRAEPKNEHELMISTGGTFICSFDNLSRVSPRLSDAICRLSTGGGFRTRALYSNGEEALFDAQRPVVLNGIPDIATRTDLVDRALTSVLLHIPEDKRRGDTEYWAAFERAHPRILGALLTAVSTALRNWPQTNLERKPRMADFARWVVAAKPALPWAPGTFLRAYGTNREESIESLIDGDPIADFIRALAFPWEGTAKELWTLLKARIDEPIWNQKDWPAKRPNQLSGCLRRFAPPLRKLGIDIDFKRLSRGKTRLITITKTTTAGSSTNVTTQEGAQPSSPSSPGLNRPGFPGGSISWEDGVHGKTEEVLTRSTGPRRAARV